MMIGASKIISIFMSTKKLVMIMTITTITNNQSTNFQIARFIKREHDEISIILVSNNATKTLEITIENQS